MKKFILLIIVAFLFGINSFAQKNVCELIGTHNNAYTKIKAPSLYLDRNSLGKIATSSFQVEYIYPQPPAEAQVAINYAVEIWSYLIHTSNFTRTIKIEVRWEDLGYSSSGSYTLAKCGPQSFYNSTSLPQANIQYPIALAEELLNQNLNGDSCEIKVTVNSNSQINWYYGTDGLPLQDRPDLVSTALHEIAHGLGFNSTFDVLGSVGMKGINDCPEDSSLFIIRYDEFGAIGSGYPSTDKLMHYDDSTSLLKAKLTSENVFFSGENAYLLNSHIIPKLYCPSVWNDGSSYTHLDDATFPAGNSNSLMTHNQDNSEVIHSPGEVGLGILKDLGWTLNRLVTFTRPGFASSFRKGFVDTLKWTDTEGGNYSLVLLDASENVVSILLQNAQAVKGLNKYAWNISTGLANGTYKIRIESGSPLGKSLVFQITDLQIVSKPEFIPTPATYPGSIYIKATCSTTGATIRYTINTSAEPTASSPVFPDSLYVTSSTTINIKAFKSGLLSSETNTGRFNIGIVPPIPEVYPESGTYANPFTFYISWQPGLQVFWNWTNNGSEPADPANGSGTEIIGSSPYRVTHPYNYTLKMKIRTYKNGQYSDLVERTYIVKPGFRIAQIDDELTGDPSFGKWSLWNVNKWGVMPDTVLIRPTNPTDYIIKAQQDYKPNTFRKYRTWFKNQLNNNYVNHAQISIDNNTSSVLAYFNNVANASVINKIDNVFSTNSGFFYLKDPWFIDDSSDTRGMRNRGKNPLPDKIYFSTSPNITTSSIHKGIFLSQFYTDTTKPFYSVKVDAVQDVTLQLTGVPTGRSHKFYFQNWSGTNANFQNANLNESPVVFTLDGATAQANLKGTQLTNTSFTESKSGQRGFLEDHVNGYLHNVYESMGSVWYERSTNNGTTWILMNNGHPINSGGNGKSPSICENLSVPGLFIVYQCNNFPYDGIVVTKFSLDSNNVLPLASGVIDEITDYNHSLDYQPVIAATGYDGGTVVCNPPVIGFRAFTFSVSGSNITTTEFSIPSSPNSTNPSIAAFLGRTHLVFQEGTISIKYYAWGQVATVTSTVSMPSGTTYNLKPVISLLNGGKPVVSWIGATTGFMPTRVNTRIGTLNGSTMQWGNYNTVLGTVSAASNASNTTSIERTLLVWNDIYGTKWQKRENTTYSIPTALSHNGSWPQASIGRGESFEPSSAKALVFNNSGLPYYFVPSTTDFHHNRNSTEGSITEDGGCNLWLGKITEEDTIVTFGRSGIASINDIEFVFDIGDIVVGDSVIRFIEIPDTIAYISTNELNQHTRTNNFTLTPNTNFYFSNIYQVVQKSDPDTALSSTDAVNFKAELVNAITNQVVGTFDNVNYNKNNVAKYASIDYSVDCSGITSGEYYLRLVTSVNGDANYTLANIFNENTTLAKKQFNKVNFTGSEIPTTYDLAQNFPNPFNPSTTIIYQIPQDGIVTLKIYDILGAEVATLVNEEKFAGKYEVNFNASNFASGVYIYKIQAGDFVSSKKMILLK